MLKVLYEVDSKGNKYINDITQKMVANILTIGAISAIFLCLSLFEYIVNNTM